MLIQASQHAAPFGLRSQHGAFGAFQHASGLTALAFSLQLLVVQRSLIAEMLTSEGASLSVLTSRLQGGVLTG